MVSLWRTLFRASPTLSNTGSTARDHLASERTFLAWIRSGLGFTALGIALERFSSLDPTLRYPAAASASASAASDNNEDSRAGNGNGNGNEQRRHISKSDAEIEAESMKEHILIGALLSLGCGSIVYASARYFSNMRLLEQGLFKPAYWGPAGTAVGVAGLAGGAYVSALRERLKERERAEKGSRRPEAREKHAHKNAGKGW